MRNNMYVVTPRCAAAAVVSAVVLRRPTKEYTHPYSMMHSRLPTARTEVAPHYHQSLVDTEVCLCYTPPPAHTHLVYTGRSFLC